MKLYIFSDFNDINILLFKDMVAIDYLDPRNYSTVFYEVRKDFEIDNFDRITYL